VCGDHGRIYQTPNGRPADARLGFNLWREQETALRRYLLERETDRAGDRYVAQVWSSLQKED
jgi:hypothetical protein